MPMPEYLRSRLIRLWSRAVAPFRPSTLTTVIVLAIIAVAGTYYQFNPPPALKDLPVGAFADQMRIKAAALLPTRLIPPRSRRPTILGVFFSFD